MSIDPGRSIMHHNCSCHDRVRPPLTRRRFLLDSALGIGSVALATLLKQERLLAEPIQPDLTPPHYDLRPKAPPAAARARAMICLFMQGGPSHIDLFEPKPELLKLDGKTFPGVLKYDNAAQATAKVMASPWKFNRHGQCGMELSELLPYLGKVADDITLIRSMHTDVNNHGQSIYAMHSGRQFAGRPTLGSWLSYGLGTENQDLPAYCALADPLGLPVNGTDNWTGGWLPSLYQGTLVRAREPRILNLDAPAELRGLPQAQYLSFLNELNQEHLAQHPGELDLEARIASYELAARMQTAAKEALDIRSESAATKELYGLNDKATAEFGTRCLIARRLVERGVRFVSVFTQTQLWDHHGSLRRLLPQACAKVDRPCAALVQDLKSRGLLDTTIVSWGGEMGRLPVIQTSGPLDRAGRDHNTYGFSTWVAGGGFKGGYVHGATDEFGHKAVIDPVSHTDYLATLLHLFGLDAQKLVYKRNAVEQTLTDNQPSRVVKELLA
jgi:hypothetical protein